VTRRLSYPKSAKKTKKTVIQHFSEVLANVQTINKVKGDEFAYLRILDIANALRDELLSRGLLLIPDDVSCWRDTWLNADGRVVTQCGVETEFELTDGRFSKRWKSFGLGQDIDGFAMSIAQTMAIKAWLKRVGLIFGERDDQEKEQSEQERPLFAREAPRLEDYKLRAFREACLEMNIASDEAEDLLSQRMGEEVTIEKLLKLSPKKFDFAIAVLKGQKDLTGDLKRSVEIVKGKAQPIVAVLDHKEEIVAGD